VHRRLTILTAVAVATIVLTGCTAQAEQPVATAKAFSGTPTAEAVDQHVGKDLQLTGEAVTDERGVYKKVELADDAPALNLDSITPTDLSKFSEADAKGAAAWALRFEADQAIDSIALDDGTAGWEKWKTDVAPEYVINDSVLATAPTSDHAVVVNTNLFGAFPTTVRDGGPRMTKDTSLAVKAISEYTENSTPMLSVTGASNVPYRVTSAGARQILKDHTDMKTDAAIDEHYPFMSAKRDVTMLVKQEWTLNLAKASGNGGWGITGQKVHNTGDFAE
jgi:hypothetical protein